MTSDFFDGFCWTTWGSECGEWGRGSEHLFFKGRDLRRPSDSTLVTSSLGFNEVISLLSCPEGSPYSLSRDSAEFLGGQPVKWVLSHCAEMMGLPHTGRMFWSHFFATKEAAAYQQKNASTQWETYSSLPIVFVHLFTHCWQLCLIRKFL